MRIFDIASGNRAYCCLSYLGLKNTNTNTKKTKMSFSFYFVMEQDFGDNNNNNNNYYSNVLALHCTIFTSLYGNHCI